MPRKDVDKVKGNIVPAKKIARGFCSLREMPQRQFSPDVSHDRAQLIILLAKKWVNGTVLHYYFFDKPSDQTAVVLENGQTEWVPWTTTKAEKDVVREAFRMWKAVGVGLEFEEVKSRDEAEIRIGFMRGDGAWSYVGRDILGIARDDRTMNFGWDLTAPGEIDTALHEIGHTLGFPHEHQNPNAGIVWNEDFVYAELAKPPNNWSRETTFYNIIRKIPAAEVRGSNWDPNSVMHYPFSGNMIREPAQYNRTGIQPAGGLSTLDRTYALNFYPTLTAQDYTELKSFQSVRLNLSNGQQRNFTITPDATRYYEIRTFGVSDSVLVLFEDVDGKLRYRTADDDSGTAENARIRVKLYAGRKYVVRVRLYHSDRAGETTLMMY